MSTSSEVSLPNTVEYDAAEALCKISESLGFPREFTKQCAHMHQVYNAAKTYHSEGHEWSKEEYAAELLKRASEGKKKKKADLMITLPPRSKAKPRTTLNSTKDAELVEPASSSTSAESSIASPASPKKAVAKKSSKKKASPKTTPTKSPISPAKTASTKSTPSKSPKKPISAAAEESREWCRKVKEIPIDALPDYAPPAYAFSGPFVCPPGRPGFDPDKGTALIPIVDAELTENEQRFIACFSRLTREVYLISKKRIFACHRWRTEEDGVTHNIESTQQVCRLDVNMASIIHRWFDMQDFFNQPWRLDNLIQRPKDLGRLSRYGFGRNGRLSKTQCISVPRDLNNH